MNYIINTLDQLKPILVGFRKSNGFSQKVVAEKLGISQQSYQALESAPQKATLERLYKVFSVLGIKLQFVNNTNSINNNSGSLQQNKDEW